MSDYSSFEALFKRWGRSVPLSDEDKRAVVDLPWQRKAFAREAYLAREGEPTKLVHRIEAGALDHLPGDQTIYLRWQELEAGIGSRGRLDVKSAHTNFPSNQRGKLNSGPLADGQLHGG